ncbi:MAG TPA: hypothetical protein VGD34_10190 [Kribbella sp.]
MKFDTLFEEAAPLISTQRHQRDTPPVEGGRWPVAAVLRPAADSELSRRLDALTNEAAALAGPGHWHTGRIGSAHLTVRALETYREIVDESEPLIQRYRKAMEAAAAQAGPASFRVTGLTLTPGTVMACAKPTDAQADLILDTFAASLGPDAWYEQAFGRRDIWYLNLLHFTTDIAQPHALIDWVTSHRSTDLGTTTIPTAELVRFHLCADDMRPSMRPQVLASAALLGRNAG